MELVQRGTQVLSIKERQLMWFQKLWRNYFKHQFKKADKINPTLLVTSMLHDTKLQPVTYQLHPLSQDTEVIVAPMM